MASHEHATRSKVKPAKFLDDEHNPPRALIRHAKVVAENSCAAATFAAIEVLTWQLVTSGVLPAEPLADELTRYAHLHPDAERPLRLLARVTRAAQLPRPLPDLTLNVIEIMTLQLILGGQNSLSPCWYPKTERIGVFDIPPQNVGDYRCDVQVMSDDSAPKNLTFIFHWRGNALASFVDNIEIT